jgi:methyltransferase
MFALFLTAILLMRGAELWLARRNRQWLLRRGAVEYGRRHYPVIVGMHVLFYLSLACERVFFSRPWDPLWPAWLALLLSAGIVRVWSMAALGKYWNTRILVVPGTRPVRSGPYRYARHPNYLVVAVEILAIAMICGAYVTATVFSVLNALVLRIRVREEECALRTLGPS